MSLPILRAYIGLYADLPILGPGEASFNFNDYAETRLVCTALGITKSSLDATELEITNGGADLLLHLVPADTTGKPEGSYPWELQVRTASPAAAWRDVAGVGPLVLQVPA
jgi:hypothetical protein